MITRESIAARLAENPRTECADCGCEEGCIDYLRDLLRDDLIARLAVVRAACDRSCIRVAAHIERAYTEADGYGGRQPATMPGVGLAGPPGSTERAMWVLRRNRLAVVAATFDYHQSIAFYVREQHETDPRRLAHPRAR